MFARIRKAVMTFVATFLATLIGAAVQNGGISLGWPQVGAAVAVALAAALAVWRVPNAKAKPPSYVRG
jgi:hypothetical protein